MSGSSKEEGLGGNGARLSGGLVDASVGLLTNVGMFVAAGANTREESHEISSWLKISPNGTGT
jgi:hypothetical protein